MRCLFDDDADSVQHQDQITCRTCVHRERWECGSKVINYCRVHKSKRTFNGLQKVKCNQQACSQYAKGD